MIAGFFQKSLLLGVILSLCTTIFSQGKGKIDSLMYLAQVQMDQEDYLEAIDLYSETIEEFQDSIDLYLRRACAFTKVKDNESAYDDIHVALMIDQSNPDIYFLIGEIEKNKKNYDGAIANYKQVLDINPDHVDAITQMVDAYLHSDKVPKAEAIISDAVKDKLTNGQLHFYKGLVMHAKGDYETALRSFHSSLIFSYSVDSSKYYLNVGNAHFGLENLMDAKDNYNQAIAHDPRELNAYYARGMVNFQMGLHEEALRDFNTAIQLLKINEDGAGYWSNMVEKKDNLIADTIVYDVVIKNPYPDDTYAQRALQHLDRQKFVEEITNAVFNGEIVAYDYETQLPIDGKTLKAIREEFEVNHVGMVKFNEQWFFDKDDFAMEKKVTSVVLGYEVKDKKGNLRGYKPYFMVYLNNYLK